MTVFGDLSNKGFALLIVVVEVHLDVGDAETHHLGYTIEQVSPILLLRIKETVLGALSRGVPWSVIGNARPRLATSRPGRSASSNGMRSVPSGS
jgi:hypothetical protein